MSVSRVSTFNYFPQLTAEIEARTQRALEEAATVGKAVAEAQAGNVARFARIPVHSTGSGYASGLKATPLARIFNKGSLGKHVGALKRPRKPSWQINRGNNPYLAHRSEQLDGKGVAPRRIFNPARLAGRKALIAGIRGR